MKDFAWPEPAAVSRWETTGVMMLSRRELIGSAAATSAALMLNRSAASADTVHKTDAGDKMTVAILIDNDVTLIDFIGPLEVFYNSNFTDVPGFSTFTVAPTKQPVRSEEGLRIAADYSLENAPEANILLIPAQPRQPTDSAKLAWLKQQAASADIVMSVCTGAFLLAQTGLLDGHSVTTHHDFYDRFAKRFPKTTLVRDVRYVDNGKMITAGGLTSGIDAAFHIVRRCYGMRSALLTAEYMEYQGRNWTDDKNKIIAHEEGVGLPHSR